MECLWCHKEFTPTRTWNKFCCDSHRVRFNQKQAGYRLPPVLDAALADMANGQQKSNIQMLCEILNHYLRPGREPIPDAEIFGQDTTTGKADDPQPETA